MNVWLAVVLLASPQLDFRGHAPEAVQKTLDAVLPQLTACLVTPPPPGKKVVVVQGRSEHLLRLDIAAPGQVAHVQVEGSSRLDATCAQHLLIRLEFGASRGKSSSTRVAVPLICGPESCAFPWTNGL